MKILQGSTGRFFVDGSGFTATDPKGATRIEDGDVECRIKCAASMGFSATAVEAPQTESFACCYVRLTDLDSSGHPKPNVVLNPSRRRFATRAGAETHGKRYGERKSGPGAAPGSAGHVGFWVITTNDPVNAAINLKTGKTVPANGAPKTFAERKARGLDNASLRAARAS